jgi:hypothetical protein
MDPRPDTRLQDLRDRIALGTYRVDPQAVAAAIVARLQAGGALAPVEEAHDGASPSA